MNITKATDPVHIISLGAGVQSSTMALMAAHGEITPMPTAAVFADTKAEAPYIYEWLDWLETQLPFPVHRVTAGSLADHSLRIRTNRTTGEKYPERMLPVFYEAHGKRQLAQRRCTGRYKIEPIQRFVHRFIKSGVIQWIGISTDEATRQRPARRSYIGHRWPLIELKMNRDDCLTWMANRGYPTPQKSSCTFCPFHSDDYWLNLKRNYPESFAGAVTFEKDLRAAEATTDQVSFPPFLHRSMVTLDKVQFRESPQPNLFENDCSGACGV